MIRVKSIELSPAPTKLTYNQGETIKITGAALKITYEDGISTTIPLKKEMLSGYDMSEIGRQEVLVNYGNAGTSFEIEVKEIPSRGLIWAASVTRPPSFKVTAFWLSCMDTAGTSTVTVHFDCRPLEADAVMVAVPLNNCRHKKSAVHKSENKER